VGNDFLYGSLLTNITSPGRGFLNIISNNQNFAPKILKPNNVNQVMNFYLYNSNLEDVNFKGLELNLSADPLLTTFINYAYLYQDLNMNGRVDSGDLLLDKRLFVQDGAIVPVVKFSGFDVRIGINEYKSFIVAFELSTAYNVTITMRTIITSGGSLIITGSPEPDIDGAPVSSNQLLLEKSSQPTPPPPAPAPQTFNGGGGGGCYVKPNFSNDNNKGNMDFSFALITLLPFIYIVFKLINVIMLNLKIRRML
jgi:hypothetical protein